MTFAAIRVEFWMALGMGKERRTIPAPGSTQQKTRPALRPGGSFAASPCRGQMSY